MKYGLTHNLLKKKGGHPSFATNCIKSITIDPMWPQKFKKNMCFPMMIVVASNAKRRDFIDNNMAEGKIKNACTNEHSGGV